VEEEEAGGVEEELEEAGADEEDLEEAGGVGVTGAELEDDGEDEEEDGRVVVSLLYE